MATIGVRGVGQVGGGTCGRSPDLGHAKPDRDVAACLLAHGLQLLFGGGHGGLYRGDLAKPALLLGLLKSAGEVGLDVLQPRQLGWVNPK